MLDIKKTPKQEFLQEVIHILLELVETESKPMKAEYLLQQLSVVHDDYVRSIVFRICRKTMREMEDLNE